jgi:peptide/nickel transport system substrate-binding protein
MKKLFIILALVVLLVTAVAGCAKEATTTPTASPTASPTSTGTMPAPSTAGPQYGGTLRVIRNYGVTNVGYPPNDGGMEKGQDVTRRLINWDAKGNVVPDLAESWDEDPVNNTLTWHLRKGVTFVDGTTFNAEAAVWNTQRLIDVKRLTEADKIKSLEVIDDYTYKMNLTQLNSQMVINYGWVDMYSPTAIETNGEEWAKTHPIGVGPFTLADWAPDNFVNLKKYDNYYVQGTPYLDGVNFRVIPDPVSASAMMEAGQADLWFDVPTKFAVDLENKGFKVNWAVTGFFWGLFANTANPDSIWNDKRLREALEYAIDRPGMAKALGYGKFEALTQIAPKDSTGYNPGYDPRPYNPDKAKALLAEAGYPDGLQTTLLCTATSQDYATAIQANLAAVGIDAKIDLADFARYNSMFMSGFFGGEGFPDLAVGMTGIDLPFATGLLRHFGPTPMTGILSINGAKSPEFLALCEQIYNTYDPNELTKVTQEAVKQVSEDALVVPLLKTPWASVMQPNVHDDSNTAHNVVWNINQSWIEQK